MQERAAFFAKAQQYVRDSQLSTDQFVLWRILWIIKVELSGSIVLVC